MRLLLDTQVFVLAVKTPEKLPRRVMAALDDPGNLLELSSVSLTEIATKQACGKLEISRSQAQRGLEDLDIRVLPYTAEHAFRLFDLPLVHRDPFDRQIIAQALAENISLVGGDEMFPGYKKLGLKLMW